MEDFLKDSLTNLRLDEPMFYVIAGFLFLWFFVRPMLVFIAEYWPHKRKSEISPQILKETGVSVIIPCHNEAYNIRQTVESLLSQIIPCDFEIILVENNSTDHTQEVCETLASKYKNVLTTSLTTKRGQSPISHAMNHGLTKSNFPVILRLDADTVLVDKRAIYKAVEPIIRKEAIATACNVRLYNCKQNILTKMQAIEYFLSMEMDRRSQQLLNSILCASGAMQGFDKKMLIDSGGYHSHPGVSEDMDVTLKMHKMGGKVKMVEAAGSLTKAPFKLKDLCKQRAWWMMLGIVCLFIHKRGIGNKRYGHRGLLGLIILPLKLCITFQAFIGLLIKGIASIFMTIEGQGINVIEWFLTFNIIHVLLIWLMMIIIAPVARVKQGADMWYHVPLFSLIYQPILASARLWGIFVGITIIIRSIISSESLESRTKRILQMDQQSA